MKAKWKYVALIAVALVIVVAGSTLLRDNKLSADEESANGTAQQLQQEAAEKEEAKIVEVTIPAPEKKEEPKEETKEESKEQTTPEQKEEPQPKGEEVKTEVKEEETEAAEEEPTTLPETETEPTEAPEAPEAPDEPEEEPEWTVDIKIKPEGQLYFGDEVEMEAVIAVPEGDTTAYTLVWQCDKGDGKSWVDIPDADKPTYRFILDEKNATWKYRVLLKD